MKIIKMGEFAPQLTFTANSLKAKSILWANQLIILIFTIYFYVFMEWLFFVTKPSFMDLMPFTTKLGIPLAAGIILVTVFLPVEIILFGLSIIPWWEKRWKLFLWISCTLPAAFIGSTVLLLIDNFTYTLFKFGIVSSSGILRGIYGLFYLLLICICALWALNKLPRVEEMVLLNHSLKVKGLSVGILLALSIVLGGSFFFSPKAVNPIANVGKATRRPNILLIGSDGLIAEHMSLYGYGRDTTPFLKSFAKTALVSENNFPNATMTASSLVSIFTGELPTETRLLYPPDIVKGVTAFQHFPGILKMEGYYNAEVSVDYYADANALNLEGSFVTVNGRSVYIGALYNLANQYLPEDVSYYLSTIAKRLYDRVLHIFFIRKMRNPYAEATQKLDTVSDQDRTDAVLSLLKNNPDPIFIHVHMMGTHTGNYNDPHHTDFSRGEKPNPSDLADFYDDAILDFDQYLHEILDNLAKIGELNNTMIIIYTDHGWGGVSNLRIPLIIRFPKGQYSGKIINNTQNADIAPTILDYIGLTPPTWMVGQSLLSNSIPATRPIFSAAPSFTGKNEKGQPQVDLNNIKPPFYQFGIIGMVICQNWYTLDTNTSTWKKDVIQNYPTPCKADVLPDNSQAEQIMLDQLKKDGFDITRTRTALAHGH